MRCHAIGRAWLRLRSLRADHALQGRVDLLVSIPVPTPQRLLHLHPGYKPHRVGVAAGLLESPAPVARLDAFVTESLIGRNEKFDSQYFATVVRNDLQHVGIRKHASE